MNNHYQLIQSPILSKSAQPDTKDSSVASTFNHASISCNCKNTKCLKLYCECFSKNKCCGPSCNCQHCKNKPEDYERRLNARTHILGRNPEAFRIDNGIAFRGCTCKKSECLKKYCECYNSMLKCGSQCKCRNWYDDKAVKM